MHLDSKSLHSQMDATYGVTHTHTHVNMQWQQTFHTPTPTLPHCLMLWRREK